MLMLHSVGDERHALNISVSLFEQLLLKLQNKRLIRLKDWEKETGFVSLTFDDVPSSFYYNAFPLLKKYRIPFTIFVSCSLLDSENYITTEMLKEIAEFELSSIGSHGCRHSFYSVLSKVEKLEELSSSQKILEGLIHKEIDLYAFPYGSFYACGIRNKNLVSTFYKYGFGTISTPITTPSLLPHYFLPRINVDEEVISKL